MITTAMLRSETRRVRLVLQGLPPGAPQASARVFKDAALDALVGRAAGEAYPLVAVKSQAEPNIVSWTLQSLPAWGGRWEKKAWQPASVMEPSKVPSNIITVSTVISATMWATGLGQAS